MGFFDDFVTGVTSFFDPLGGTACCWGKQGMQNIDLGPAGMDQYFVAPFIPATYSPDPLTNLRGWASNTPPPSIHPLQILDSLATWEPPVLPSLPSFSFCPQTAFPSTEFRERVEPTIVWTPPELSFPGANRDLVQATRQSAADILRMLEAPGSTLQMQPITVNLRPSSWVGGGWLSNTLGEGGGAGGVGEGGSEGEGLGPYLEGTEGPHTGEPSPTEVAGHALLEGGHGQPGHTHSARSRGNRGQRRLHAGPSLARHPHYIAGHVKPKVHTIYFTNIAGIVIDDQPGPYVPM